MDNLQHGKRLRPFGEITRCFVDTLVSCNLNEQDHAAKDGQPQESADGIVGAEVFFGDVASGQCGWCRAFLCHLDGFELAVKNQYDIGVAIVYRRGSDEECGIVRAAVLEARGC